MGKRNLAHHDYLGYVWLSSKQEALLAHLHPRYRNKTMTSIESI